MAVSCFDDSPFCSLPRSKAETGKHSATHVFKRCEPLWKRASSLTARNAEREGIFQAPEVTRVPEDDIYLVYYIYVYYFCVVLFRRKLGVPLAKPNQLGLRIR